jgi:formate dehydrogenase maturation protein FdhE
MTAEVFTTRYLHCAVCDPCNWAGTEQESEEDCERERDLHNDLMHGDGGEG